MKQIKQIASFLMLTIFFVSSFGNVFANEKNIYKQTILLKNSLKSEKQGEKYIATIDQIVEKYKNDKTKLEKLKIKTGELVKKLENNHGVKYRKTKKVVKYLDLKVQVSIYDIERAQLKEKLMTKFKSEGKDNNDEQAAPLSQVTSEENKKINTALINIQQNLLEKGTSYIQKPLNDNSYEEIGDFNMNINIDYEDIGNLKASLGLHDYTQKILNSNFQLQGKINSSLETNIVDGENIKFSFDSLLDLISKDGDMYLLIEKLNIIDETGIEEIKTYLESIKQIASQNKYIKFENQETQQGLKMIENFKPKKILSDGKEILSKPMFQAYKKENEKYYLIPTKYGCDNIKIFMNTFDPFNGKECSQKQYQDLIEKTKRAGSLYIKLGNEIKLGFEGIKNSNIPEINWYIIFTEDDIKEMQISISLESEYLTFHSELHGANKKITGNTLVQDSNRETLFSMEHTGEYDKNYFELNNTFEAKNIYEDQIKKSRDVTRITHLNALMGAIEQVFQDNSEYPTSSNFENAVSEYLYGVSIPQDPLGNVEINGCKFGYIYEVGEMNGVPNQIYKLSSCLESESSGRAKNDGGTDEQKYEKGILRDSTFEQRFYINSHTRWTKQVSNEHMIKGNFNIKTDTRESKNNLNIYLDGNIADKKVFQLEVDNTSLIENKSNIKIEKPDSDSITPSNEVIGNFMVNPMLGYAQDARNSKRATDLNSILKVIEIKMSYGGSFPSFIVQNEDYTNKEIFIAGEKVKIGENYFVGTPNYNALGIKKEDFLDPLDGSEYIIGVTLKKDIEYEILGKMEGGKNRNYVIMGTYHGREKEKIEVGEINSTRITIKNNADINKIKKGDTINLGTVKVVSRDGKTLTLDTTINNTSTYVELLEDEPKGLIFINGKIVENDQIIE